MRLSERILYKLTYATKLQVARKKERKGKKEQVTCKRKRPSFCIRQIWAFIELGVCTTYHFYRISFSKDLYKHLSFVLV